MQLRFAWLLLALPLAAQVHVTLSPQGAEALRTASGKRIQGVGLVAVTAVNHGPARTVQAQEIYALAAHLGIAYIAPNLAEAMLTRTAARSKARIGLDAIALGSGVSGVLGTTKAVSMGNGLAAGLSLAPIAIPILAKFLSDQQPAAHTAIDALLRGSYQLAQGGALPDGRLMLVRYHGDWMPREGDIAAVEVYAGVGVLGIPTSLSGSSPRVVEEPVQIRRASTKIAWLSTAELMEVGW